jgi:hypothetical protein
MRIGVLIGALSIASCSDGGSSTGTTSSGGGGGGGGGSGTVSLDASRIFNGNLTLSGTITLPPGSGAGKSIQLTASGGGEDITQSGSQVGPAGTTPGDTVPYTVTGLVEGTYSIRARVDMDANGSLEAGDLDGYTGGTVAAPVVEFTKAVKVTVGPSGATGVDFGLGKVGSD